MYKKLLKALKCLLRSLVGSKMAQLDLVPHFMLSSISTMNDLVIKHYLQITN